MSRHLAVVYLAPNRWSGARQRTQHIAEGLARTREVLYVEPAAYSINGAIRRRLLGQDAAPLLPRVARVGPRLTVFTPSPSLPFSLHHRRLNQVAHLVSLAQLLRQRSFQLGRTNPELDVIVGWPAAVELARWLRPSRIFYDCMDRFPLFHSGPSRRLMERYDAELSQISSAVIVPSRMLERLWEPRTSKVARIPNGVEVERFTPGRSSPPEPPDLQAIPHPRIGYVGTVGPWLDLELLASVAAARSDLSFVAIGPIDRDLDTSKLSERLHCLGPRPYEQVPEYLAWLDVLLIPFRINELTEAVNPIKLYEYCASGKPIVATPIEEVAAHQELCYLGQGVEGLQNALSAALVEASNPVTSRRVARQRLARENSWERRVAAYEELLATPTLARIR